MANPVNLEISLGRTGRDGPDTTAVTNDHLQAIAAILSRSSDLQYRYVAPRMYGLGSVESITQVPARSVGAVTRAMAGQSSAETLTIRTVDNRIVIPTEILDMITNPDQFKRDITTQLPVIFLNDTYIVGLNIPDSWIAQGAQITPITLARSAGGYRRKHKGKKNRKTHRKHRKSHRKNRKTRRN